MKTSLSPTLTLYIGGRFFAWLLGVSVLLGCITLLGDSIELLRRSADKPDVTFALVMLMAILKLPATAQEVMPFGLLAATLGCLTQLLADQRADHRARQRRLDLAGAAARAAAGSGGRRRSEWGPSIPWRPPRRSATSRCRSNI